jgi:hypothetical protein
MAGVAGVMVEPGVAGVAGVARGGFTAVDGAVDCASAGAAPRMESAAVASARDLVI